MTNGLSAGLGLGLPAPFQGPPGPDGPAGITSGFGSITYSHLIADPASTDPTVRGLPLNANEPRRRPLVQMAS